MGISVGATTSVRQVVEAVEELCPGVAVAGARELGAGHSSEQWLLDTDQGELLLRSPVRDRAPAALMATVAATRLAGEGGLPVVEYVAVSEHCAALGGPAVVQEYVPGETGSAAWPAMSIPSRRAVAAELGDLVARLHTCSGESHGDVLGSTRFPSLWAYAGERVASAVTGLRSSGVDGQWEAAGERVTACFEAIGDASPRLVHRDLYLDNVVVRDGRVAALLDFEHAGYSDQFEDFGKLDELVFGWWPETREPFLESYRAVHPLDDAAHRRIHAHVGLYNLVVGAYFSRWQPDFVPGYADRVAKWLVRDASER